MTIREEIEQREQRELSPYACLSTQTKGREYPAEACPIRTCFQRDIDRIVHCKAFRRLKHKTQVFLQPLRPRRRAAPQRDTARGL